MKLKPSLYLIPGLLAVLLGVAGCSKQDAAAPAASAAAAAAPAAPAGAKRAISLDLIAAEAKGFPAGAVMSANTTYVFFDPQCPHCGHLWQASLPLQSKAKFVWIPVAFISQVSGPQGAALLSSSNPVQAMTDHEASLMARQGGISASASVPAELQET